MIFRAFMSATNDWHSRLESILGNFGCQTGTIHRTDASGQALSLVAQIGVPEFLVAKISQIPFGKGIAGAAAASRAPVELCNLQQDFGGVAEANARQTGVAGSLAVPIFSASTDAVLGTLGIGKNVPHDFTEDEKRRLAEEAAAIARQFDENAERGD